VTWREGVLQGGLPGYIRRAVASLTQRPAGAPGDPPAVEGADDADGALTIDFGAGGNGSAFTAAGWSTPEPAETWSVGERSWLILPARGLAAAYIMRLTLRPNVVAGRLVAQRLRVAVNGHPVAQFSIGRRCVRACRIPWSVLDGQAQIEVAFDMPDAARPADFGGSDGRQLGVALAELQLYPDAHAAGLDDATDGAPMRVDVSAIMAADRIAVAELMGKFESLGQNCEFGLVQRRCEAEPLGLLRFSSTPLPKLLDALDARFEGMGDADSIRVELSSNGREYMISDTRFGFLYHAFVESGAMAADALHRREVKRVPFLVGKLLDDLATADKIFVFKGMGAMEEEEVFPLAMALRRYGPNTLLFINLADRDHPGGHVEVRAPGFTVGYLDRFAPSDDASDFELAQWVRVCRGAYRLRLAGGE
jgi:hypothetical protein